MAAKSAFPNSAKLPPVKGHKDHAGKSAHPNQPHLATVKGGSKVPYPNAGSGPKQSAKSTTPGPSVKSPTGPGPARSNIDSKQVAGILGNLKVGRLGK